MTVASPDVASLADFRARYTAGGVQGAFWAALLACLSYLAFLIVALVGEASSPLALGIRLGLVLMLAGAAILVWREPRFLADNYACIAGGISGITLLATVYLLSIGPNGHPSQAVGASPSLMFGLFIHYAFLRLPLWCAAGVGVGVSLIFITWGAPIVLGGNEQMRTILYLVLANAVGFIACRVAELRERDLFFERLRVREAEEFARDRAAIAEEQVQSKERLLAALAHDIRAPLAASRGYMQLVSGRAAAMPREALLEHIDNATRSIDLVGLTLDHVLAAGSLERAGGRFPMGEFDLRELLERLRLTLQIEADARGVELVVQIVPERLMVRSDPGALWQVLLNLGMNAVKFARKASAPSQRAFVAIHCRVRDGHSCVRILDSGDGIPVEYREEIWAPYVQIAKEHGGHNPGVGLGLFLVRRAIDNLDDHRIRMCSRVGRGTLFTVSLPLAQSDTTPPMYRVMEEPVAQAHREALFGAFLLVVYDSEERFRLVADILNRLGTVFLGVSSLQPLAQAIAEEERLIDAIVLITDGQSASLARDRVRQIRDLLDANTLAIILAGERQFKAVPAAVFDHTLIVREPIAPTLLAEAILVGVAENRRREMEE